MRQMHVLQCAYCGRYIKNADFDNKTAKMEMVYSYWPVPEPSHEEYFHVACSEKAEAE